jgi:3-hydroxyacyl-CoA dehydrogenase/enoyl-CoA hydratase/carnithine racemase
VFDRAAFDALEQTLAELETEKWVALVLTGKPFVFAVGADLDEFPKLSTPDLAREASRRGHELFGRLRALPFPSVAAINGACLGGGVELALHCDARTISTAVRHFACPEVFLGIIPGWGGTQLVPRLVGVSAAVRFIVENPLRQNRMLDGAKAFEAGFADRLVEPAEFVDESIGFALELLAEGGVHRNPPELENADDVLRRARTYVDDVVHAAAPAPYRAVELIAGACSGWSIDDGYRAEEDAVAELLPSRQAQASLYAFDLVERRAKRGVAMPDTEARPVQKVGFVGAGLMATQLATLFLRRLEVPIVLRDLDPAAVETALDAIRADVQMQVAKGRYDDGKARFLASIVSGSTDYDGFADCDLVLEAVYEELDVKKQVFADVEEIVSPECLLATNTSALSVTAIAADLDHRQRVVGMHFFNPVALLPLVELVRAAETDDVAVATAWSVAERLRKRPVVVGDAPAFVVNRVLARLMSVVLDALEHGNSVTDVDDAILRLGLPMAPSVLLQMVGPRVANHVLETLHEAYPERFPLSQTLANYAAGNDEMAIRGEERRTADEILDHALAAIADEVRHILEEGVVREAADVDTALLLGAGWPFFLGGITKFLDQTGVSGRVVGRPLADVRTPFEGVRGTLDQV